MEDSWYESLGMGVWVWKTGNESMEDSQYGKLRMGVWKTHGMGRDEVEEV